MRAYFAAILVAVVPLVASAQTPSLPLAFDDQLFSSYAQVQPGVWNDNVGGRYFSEIFRTQVPFGTLPGATGSRQFHPDLYGNWIIAFIEANDAGLSRPMYVTGTSEDIVDDWGIYRHPRIWNQGMRDGSRYVVEKQEQYPTAIDWDVMWYAFDQYGVAKVQRIGDDLRDQIDPAVWEKYVVWAEQTRPGPLGYEVLFADEGDLRSPRTVGVGRHPDVNGNAEVVYESFDMSTAWIAVDGNPLGMEPFGECAGFHAPKWGGSRFVLFSGYDCLASTGVAFRMLYLADRQTGCTWMVDRLPAPAVQGAMMDAWLNEDDPAAYDIDEAGNIVYSKWIGPDWADFDFFYVTPDFSSIDKGC